MNNVIRNDERGTLQSDAFLRATALLYLREALDREAYEECRDLVASARKYGARPDEINRVLQPFRAKNRRAA